jgi:hypothetical protein
MAADELVDGTWLHACSGHFPVACDPKTQYKPEEKEKDV